MIIIGKGNVITSHSFEVPKTKKHLIEFKPTSSMAPNVKAVVYFVTEDGELITDSVNIEFGNELKNQVSLKVLRTALQS